MSRPRLLTAVGVAVILAVHWASVGAGPSGPLSGHLPGPRAAAAAARPRRADVVDDDGSPLAIPDDFIMGAGSSSYQIEGAWDVNGKGVSSVDVAYGNRSDSGGKVACDSYDNYKQDIAMLKLMGASHYRFSIAWARLLPTGEADSLNPDGVRYYNAVLDELEANGIQPLVTLWHVDIPMALESAFGGWQDARMADYFETFAVTAFTQFGSRVRYWATLNEPQMFCVYGGGHGRMGATKVDQGRSEYLCGHHVLLAHAKAYRAYRKDFFASQGGKVGISLNNYYTRPCSVSYDDVLAAERHQQFEVGWFLEPILSAHGDYPPLMRQAVGSRLPTFTAEQKTLLKDSLDYIGLNSYYGWTGCHGVPDGAGNPSYERDESMIPKEIADINSPPAGFSWSPWSIRSSLLWMKNRYDPQGTLPFIITENGYSTDGSDGLEDDMRVAYLSAWMRGMLNAIYEDKIKVIGYFVWSLMDDFEWGGGYGVKLGLVHVDFDSPARTRTPKKSLYFMKDVIASRKVPLVKSSSALSLPSIATVFTLILLSLSYSQ